MQKTLAIIGTLVLLIGAELWVLFQNDAFMAQAQEVQTESDLLDQMFYFFLRFLFHIPLESSSTLNNQTKVPSVTATDNAVLITVSYPQGGSIVSGASNVEFLNFTINNSREENIAITELAFLRTGVGSVDDFESVTLFENDRRIVSSISLNRNNEARFRLLSRPLIVEAGSLRTFSFRANLADIPGISNHENSFVIMKDGLKINGVESGESITPNISPSTATTIRTVPISGKNELRVSPGPSIGNDTFLSLRNSTTFGYFTLAGASAEDIKLNAITLKISKHAELFTDAYLEEKSSGEKVCELVQENRSNERLSFNCTSSDYLLPRSSSRIFSIRGKLEVGQGIISRTDRLTFSLEEPEDIVAVTVPSGFGLNIIDEY